MNNPELIGKLANPKLTLFAFHLCNNLAKGDKQLVDKAEHLWQKCVALGHLLQTNPQLDFLPENLSNRNSQNSQQVDYLELYESDGDKFVSFTTVSQPDQLPLTGEIYPLQLHDTYALDFTLRSPNSTVEINQLSNLNFQGCLLPCEIQASLGQTLVLFAKPVDFAGNHQDLAVACVDALFQNSELKQPKPYLIGDGKLLGSPIFEFDNSQEDPSLKCHILVWLDTDEKTSEIEELGNYYRPLLNLLCCRSKILYVYHQAYLCNEEARKLYSQLEEKVEEFSRLKSDREQRLEQLEGWLTELPKIGLNYARYLRDIELHQIAIETNAKNYSHWLKTLGDFSVQEMDNLDFIQEFVDRSCPKFQEQIKVNMSYLTVGRQLFQQMIETIRGIVEVDAQKQQVEYDKKEKDRDRNLQITIAVVGVGIGVAGVVSSSYTLAVDKPWASPSFQHPLPLHPFFSAIIVSCICGGGLGAIALLTARKLFKRSDDRTSLPSSENQPRS
ncbi:hypothetical protein D0A34_18920 [Microcoleus vaginatus PCC 9802]|uniref:hypothetical protein n=1 Tax=Microcoleus vaginatus TaxID=119532 RepID=UPI00020D2225|nr:hypothetical protein MicvaDRAFT_2238 [Microcoleus vaginatus FGP-2]UNU20675.1 hypothetical protein D0A34_18920 [Microcoleus vaginatus PCC 9802]